jgi:elongation factor G
MSPAVLCVPVFQITTDEDNLHVVLGDLARRRSRVLNITASRDVKVLETLTPLAELRGYSTDLRTITSGMASFAMDLSHYDRMTGEEQEAVLKSPLGMRY